jgi:flagella basal body P-ring formation protein FlgA
MLVHTSLPAMRRARPGAPRGVTAGAVLRVLVAVALLCLAALPVLASPALRAEATARGDAVTLGDLVDGLPEALAATPAFRAPAIGETGTIQAARVVEAAARHGVRLDPADVAQVVVRRAGRRVDLAEVEAAVKAGLELRHGVEARGVNLLLDGALPTLGPVADDALIVAEDITFDPRSRRFTARVAVAGGQPRPLARVAGQAIEMAEVQVLSRAFNRGEMVQAADVTVERRPKAAVPGDALLDPGAIAGRTARRSLPAGSVLRTGDLQRPEIVARGEIVTIVYEIPGMTLTLRGRANEAGAQGDVIAVTNPQSKRTLQATVAGPGRVAVSAATATPGPLAERPLAQRP